MGDRQPAYCLLPSLLVLDVDVGMGHVVREHVLIPVFEREHVLLK